MRGSRSRDYGPPVATGRQTAERALRAPLTAAGWDARAAGWFTRAVGPDHLGVLALGSASEHTQPGTALVTIHVGVRQESVEGVVAALEESKAGDYRDRTAVTSIGYLMPERRWRDWLIDGDTADRAAVEMCDAVTTYAEPWLVRMTTDTDGLLSGVKAAPSFAQSTGLIRYTVLLVLSGQADAARAFLSQRSQGLEDRTDPAADKERRAISTLLAWLPPPV